MTLPDDDFYKKMLASFPAPLNNGDARSQTLSEALTALRDVRGVAPIRPRSYLLVASLTVAGCLALWAVFLHFESIANRPTAIATGLIADLEKLFPGQLNAVILRGGDVELRLADLPSYDPVDQQICMTLKRKDQLVQIFTYSGRTVCLHMDQQSFCLTPLLTGEDDVLVLTDDDLVNPSGGFTYDGFQVSAERLSATSL